ncbi:MAG: outer membrane lipoprotein-sorting protein [bacterium]
MKIIQLFNIAVILSGLGIHSNAQDSLSAREIMEKSLEAVRLAGTESVATMTIIDSNGRERIRKIAQVTKLYDQGNTEKKLVRFLAPADVKGTGLLTYDYSNKDDDIWLYMPALRKTRRIISSEKAKSFMGSEFSYADMTPAALKNFTFNLLGEEKVNGVAAWKIEMIPINDDVADENGYSKRISWIGKENFVLRKSVYYDWYEELHKELNILNIRELDSEHNKFHPLHLVMINKQNNRKSIFKINKIEYNPDIDDAYFTVRYLERE